MNLGSKQLTQSGSFRLKIQIQNSELFTSIYSLSIFKFRIPIQFGSFGVDLQFGLRMFFRSRIYITFRIVHFYIKPVYIQIQFGSFGYRNRILSDYFTHTVREYTVQI